MTLWALLLTTLAIAPSIACAYLLLLTLLSASSREPSDAGPAQTRFDVIVPAHDEEAGIGGTVSSLLDVAYPRELYRVVVVADNCLDRTADVARKAGAHVLVRDDREHPGKGRALSYAFERVVAEDRDAAVVADADTIVSPNLLAAFDARLRRGAKVVQCEYAVRNPGASWRTLLMAVALGSFHALRSLGRARLGASCGLRGNGMCFAASLLREVRHDAYSIVEDVEYGLRLGEAGYSVAYAPEARVYGEMVTGEQASRSQRRRWEGGRARMRRRGWGLLAASIRKRSGVLLDLAIDVLLPPLSTLALVVASGAFAACALATARPCSATIVGLAPWAFCAASLVAYVARGWHLSGTGVRGLLALAHVPGYLAWKIVLSLHRDRLDAWVRTARGGEPSARSQRRG